MMALIEMECMSCGDHEIIEEGRRTSCHGCNHGSMQPYHAEDWL